MPRIFPRAAEAALRTLKQICEDDRNPAPMRARSAELLLSAYGLAGLPPERIAKHNGLRSIQGAVELSGIDKAIAGKVRAQRKEQSLKLKKELEKL